MPKDDEASPEEEAQLRAQMAHFGKVIDQAAGHIGTGIANLVRVGVNPVTVGALTSQVNAIVHALLASYADADEKTANQMLEISLEDQRRVFARGRQNVVPMEAAPIEQEKLQ